MTIDSLAFSITNTLALLGDAGSPGGGLVKMGSGTLVLASGNTYTGLTIVSNGTLMAAANFDVASGSQVQVANGTSTAGIATTVTTKLMNLGWGTLPPVNASSTVPSSAIYYAAGKKAAGLLLAKELSLPASSVQPLTTSVPVPGSSGDDLVLLVGPDLAS